MTDALSASAVSTPRVLLPCANQSRSEEGHIDSFCVLGDVRSGVSVTLDELRSMPTTTITATAPSGSKSQPHSYTGVLLTDLLDAVGLRTTDEGAKLGTSVSVTASDQHWITFSLGELNSSLGNTSALIAYQQDGQALASGRLAELIVPTDKQDSRWIASIAGVYVYTFSRAVAPWANPVGQSQGSFSVDGFIQTPQTTTLDELRSMPTTTVTATAPSGSASQPRSYTGVRLTDLLRLRAQDERARMGMSVSVLPNGGDWITFSLGELDSSLGNTSALIAYQQDGQALTGGRLAELIVPTDKQDSRWIASIAGVYVYYPFPADHG